MILRRCYAKLCGTNTLGTRNPIVTEEKQAGAAGQGESIDFAKYTMTSPVEIAQHLKSIVASGYTVTVFSNRGRSFILSRLLDLDSKAGVLVFDMSSSAEQNQKLLESERNVFVCSPQGVKTQFATGQVQITTYEGKEAFVVSLPTEAIKLQRREFFRIQAPLVQPILCNLSDYPGGDLQLAVYDISLGGVGLWLPRLDTPGFEIGKQYRHCTVELKPLGTLRADIEVRHRMVVQQRNGNEMLRAGCAYLNLPSAMENLVQRYVALLERERRALVR